MRKMKKFLAVTLSAAMVLSVSVPAMAANASNTETAINYASWEAADKDLETKQDAYETAELNLEAAKTAVDTLKTDQRAGITKTDTDVRKAEDEAKKAVSNLASVKEKASDAAAAALVAEQKAADAKDAYDKAVADYNTKNTAYEKNKNDKTYDKLQLAKDKKALDDAADEVARTTLDYLGDETQGIKGKADLAKDAEELAEGYQVEVEGIVLNTAIYVGIRDAYQYLVDAKGDYEDALAKAQADLKTAQDARDAALKALNEAKEAERAARAKLDTARQNLAEENYKKAVIREQRAQQIEDDALAALNDAQDELTEIQNRIKGYLEDIDAYYDAWADYEEANDDVQNAAADMIAAKAKLDTAEYLLEVADDAVENTPDIVAMYEDRLDFITANSNDKTATNITDLVRSREAVKNAKKELETMTNQYPKDTAAVQANAWAFYANCEDEYERACEAYQDALDNVEKARKNIDDAFDKEQTAVKALYVTVDSGLVHTYNDGHTAKIYKPHAVGAEGTLLDRYEGMWVEMSWQMVPTIVGVTVNAAGEAIPEVMNLPSYEPITDANGIVLFYDPEKLDYEHEKTADTTKDEYRNSAYRWADNVERLGYGQYVWADTNRKAIFNKEEPTQTIPAVVVDGRYYDYTNDMLDGDYSIAAPAYSFNIGVVEPQPALSLKGVSKKWLDKGVGDTMRIPAKCWIAVAPYAQEIIAQANVDALKDAYIAAQEAHKLTEDMLTAAEEDYEYCFGHKPGEMNQATKQIVAGFKDVTEDDWFATYVADVVDKGLMKGYAATNFTTFGSYDTLQRQDFVMILWNMAGNPVVNATVSFKDFDPNAYYANAIRWAVSKGIVKGYNKDEFGIGKNITREDFTLMLHRYYGYPQTTATFDGFADASSVSNYAEIAVKWAIGAGAITGKNEGTIIDPQAPIARCESAKILSILTD